MLQTGEERVQLRRPRGVPSSAPPPPSLAGRIRTAMGWGEAGAGVLALGECNGPLTPALSPRNGGEGGNAAAAGEDVGEVVLCMFLRRECDPGNDFQLFLRQQWRAFVVETPAVGFHVVEPHVIYAA